MSIMAFWISNFKFQYWIPVALPLFSTMINFLPETLSLPRSIHEISMTRTIRSLPNLVIGAAIVLQVSLFTISDFDRYMSFMNKVQGKPALLFYDLAIDALKPLSNDGVFVYYDVRMYFPPPNGWKAEAVFKPLDYDYILSQDFDVVLLMQQRIYDYIDPSVEGIHPEEFALSRIFYQDANAGVINGYHLVFRNDFGLVFVKDELYQQFFEQ